jgi:hypothetical protein
MRRGYEIRFYVGLKDKDGREVEPETYLEVMNQRHPGGYTCYQADGYWQGSKERSLVLEVIRERDDYPVAPRMAEITANLLREAGNQDAVLITVKDMDQEFVTGTKE